VIRSFFFRIFLLFIIIITIFICITNLFISYGVSSGFDSYFAAYNEKVKNLVINVVDINNINRENYNYLEKIKFSLNAEIEIYNDTGTYIIGTKGDNSPLNTLILQRANRQYDQINYERYSNRVYVITVSKKDNRYIRITTFYNKNINGFLAKFFIIIYLGVIVISLFFSLIVTKSFYSRVNLIKRSMQKVSNGDFSIKIDYNKKDDLTGVIESFNYMVSYINSLFIKLQTQKNELDAIINSIEDGIIVVENDGRVKYFNSRIPVSGFTIDALQGRYIHEIYRLPEIIEHLIIVRRENKSIIDEVKISDNYYCIVLVYLELNREILVIFRDITRQKELEMLKKSFVSNVSHELRTPLTSIKGFIETIKDDPVNISNIKYIDIIDRNTDRLINIVNDLLILSKVDDKTIPLSLEKTDIKTLVKDTIKIFYKRLIEKKMKIKLKFSKKTPRIVCDKFKIEQMIINLIDNGIKYSEQGAVTVIVKNLKSDRIRITVSDSGVGIPEDSLDKIFDRFYVVNKSRTRSLGGTGLGLSIVKNIVALHKGTIKVKSSVGEGTKFIVELPINQGRVSD